jgi:hypothetical protein
MREASSRILALNGMDPEQWQAMTEAGVNLGPIRHARLVVAGRWVDTTDLDHIPSAEDLDALEAVASQGWADPDDREAEVLLERAAWDLGPADEEW